MSHKREPDERTDQLAREVIGTAIEVHRELGPGFLESTYQEAMAIELRLRGIPFRPQVLLGVHYKGHDLEGGRVDLLVGGVLVVELKAVSAFSPIHTAKVLSYLKAAQCHLGLLINFDVPLLRDGIRRIINS